MIIFLGSDYTTNLCDSFIKSVKHGKDIVVSFNYRYRVPESLLEKFTCVNIHSGKLPEYAGCNPIYWQMRNKEEYAGCTLHYMDKDLDTGDIIAISYVKIGTLTACELREKLAKAGLKMLRLYYTQIVKGTAPRQKQDKTKRIYYRKDLVDFSKEKHISLLQDANALYFEGKQNPVVNIKGREWELKPYENRINKSS